MDNQTKRLYLLVAGAPNHDDVINLLEALADAAADVRVDLPGVGKDDSIAVRKAVNNCLKEAIDTLRKIKNNQSISSSVGDD